MANDLRMELILQAIDRATRPIRAVTQGSIGLGRALKESRDQLKQLQAQQNDISSWRTLRAASQQTDTALQAARDRVKALGKDLASTGVPTRQMTRDLKAAIREATALKKQHQEQQTQLQGLRTKLSDAGISTRNLSQQERELRARIEQTNKTISEQGRRMQALSRQAKQAAAAKAQFNKAQQVAGSMATGGAAGLASGYAMARPLKGMVDAFAPAENAATQLKVAMMDQDGKVSGDFQKITDLATSLGDRLPGTTADFTEMMTMLRRQGLSAANILGGTGEAAAYLAVQLNMPVTAAAEFAAKMQDATRTSEKDMLALMDTIQRTSNLGVESGDMLQGLSKISPVMDIIKQSGLDAANTLTPLLVMMDQTGMAGESAGNAFRKVFQGAMNNSRISKTLADLKTVQGIDLSLDFTDGKGEFGGIKQMYAQLDKLKDLSTETRLQLIKDLFGDDSETLQVLNTMMNKGIAGYDEVAGKMQTQADLRTRVNEQLGTLTNMIEAAEGSWSNAMSEMGATVAPELKEFIEDIGNMAVSLKGWVKEHPALTAAIIKTAAGLALLLTVGGGIGVMVASFLGPFAMARFALTMLGIKGVGAASSMGQLFPTFIKLGKGALGLARTAIPALIGGIRMLGIALLTTPLGWFLLAVTAIAAIAYAIWANWDTLGPKFAALWASIQAGAAIAWEWIKTKALSVGQAIADFFLNWTLAGLIYKHWDDITAWMGQLPGKFTTIGSQIMQGMVNGITNSLGAVKDAITGAADSTVGWFKEKLGIHSPSRVFAELGGFTMAGLEQGLVAGQGGPLGAVTTLGKQLAAAGAITFGAAGGAMAMDNRPPLGAAPRAAAATASAPAPIVINVYPSAGMDEQALARLVGIEVDKIQRRNQARGRSALSDQE